MMIVVMHGGQTIVIGKRKVLELNVPAAKVRRSDPVELRKRILSITASERKSLGINKSTLWYQKKKLTEGKTLRVYSKVLAKMK